MSMKFWKQRWRKTAVRPLQQANRRESRKVTRKEDKGSSDWLGLLLCILSVSEVTMANMEQPEKDSSKKSQLQQAADDFCRQGLSTRLITRVSTKPKNPVEYQREREPGYDEMPCPARLRLVKGEKQHCDENVDDGNDIERAMKDKGLRHANNDRYDCDDRNEAQRISRCGVGWRVIAIALALPKVKAIAESLDELTHRPNEKKLSDSRRERARLRLKLF
jgi:hypothetical protein